MTTRVPNNVMSERDYQKQALLNLKTISDNEEVYSTAVAIPVGGGKTFVAMRHILNECIPEGFRCFWIAPSVELVNQAVGTLRKLAPHESYIKVGSGRELANVSADEHFVFMTEQLAACHQGYIAKIFEGATVLLCIDEAHHSLARTYQEIRDKLKSATERLCILGLTATPFRTIESETPLLGDIFTVGVQDGKVSYETGEAYKISMEELINQGYLAMPRFIKMRLRELMLGIGDEYDALEVSEIPVATVVDHYLEHSHEYKKTIIFAVNTYHAQVLVHRLRAKGVRAAVAINGDTRCQATNPPSPSGNGLGMTAREAIAEYRSGNVDVIVTVRMLGEGFDVPDTKTVILTKFKIELIEFTQCIGRALRRKEVGNYANIVYFDSAKITSFNEAWEMKDIVTGQFGRMRSSSQSTDDNKQISQAVAKILDIPYGVIAMEDDVFNAPCGCWVYEDNRGVQKIIVYDNNQGAFQDFITRIASFSESMLEELWRRLNGANGQLPISKAELRSILHGFWNSGQVPEFYGLDEQTENLLCIENYARQVEELPTKEMKAVLRQTYDDTIIIRYAYHTLADFIGAVTAYI